MKKLTLVFITSLLLSFGLFGNGISGDFVFDDTSVVSSRGDLKDPGNFLKLFISPYHQNTPESGLYRPFTMASYAINHYIADSPVIFHIINIILHALNGLLVYWLVQYLFKSKFLSFASMVLFISHPIHTEAVTSIVGRAELWAFFWSMLTIIFFLRKKMAWSGVSLFFGLLSKEIAIAVIPLILCLDMFFQSGSTLLNSLKKVRFYLIPLGLYALLRYQALSQYFLSDSATTFVENPLKFASVLERIGTALAILTIYIKKLILPTGLSADYSYNTIPIVANFFTSPSALIGLAILIVLVGLLFHKKVPKEIALSVTIFLLPYLVISNLIKPIGTIMAERLMYIPSLGLALVVAFGLSILIKKGQLFKKMGYGALLVVLILYGTGTFLRNQDWSDNYSLFSAAVKESPNSVVVRTALAGVYVEAGEWGEAKEQLEMAEGIYSDYSRLQNLQGIVADHEGNYLLAVEKYKRSLVLNPNAINTHINIAELYIRLGKYTEAKEHLLKVIEFHPAPEYVIRYAYIQIVLKDPDGAIATVNKYFDNNSSHPDLSALIGTAYFVKGDYEEALRHLKMAQKLGNQSLEIKQMVEIINKR